MDKKLEDRIRTLKSVGVKQVTLSTNVSLMTEARAKSILATGIDDIMFSIDGFSKEVFESIRPGLIFEEVRDNALRFIKLRTEGGHATTVRVRMVYQEKNEHEHADWEKFWRGQVGPKDRVYAKPLHSWGNQKKDDGVKPLERPNRPCVTPWSTMVIHCDGVVPMCPFDFKNAIPAGDFSRSSIREIWQDAPYRKLREIHAAGRRNEIELCRDCNVFDPAVVMEKKKS